METVQTALWVVVVLVALAIVFDFMNGFHDAANSIATVVSTGVLKPAGRVFAAFSNFIAIFVFHLSVARHHRQGHRPAGRGRYARGVPGAGRRHHLERHHLVLRHSQQLLARADRRHRRRGHCQSRRRQRPGGQRHPQDRGLHLHLAAAGHGAGLGHDGAGGLGFRRTRPNKVDKWFRRLQLVSARAYSLGHGGNDAQKTIGIIWLLLIATGYASASDSAPPTWTIVSCYAAIGLGTMFGGWRIVKTMGQKITKLKPVGGFCAETGRGA